MTTGEAVLGRKKVSQSTAGQKVAEYIRQYITSNDLVHGDSLPSEMELAEKLQISRSAVREGLKQLQVLGMVESRRKRGMIVKTADLKKIFRMIAPSFSSDHKLLEELFDLRFNTESSMVDLLVMNATAEDIQQIKNVIEKMKTCDSVTRLFALDKQLHVMLYQATHNRFISSMAEFLDLFYERTLQELHSKYDGNLPPNYISQNVNSHNEIVAALDTRDSMALRQAIKKHLLGNPLAKRPPYIYYSFANGLK